MGRTILTLKLFIIIWVFFYSLILILLHAITLLDEVALINTSQANLIHKLKVEESNEPELAGKIMPVSAYNAGDPAQCNGDPCISATGDNICLLLEQGINVCALNDIPFYTILEVEEMGECVVLDRTSTKFSGRVDWAMKKDEYDRAVKFGVKNLIIKISNKTYGQDL